MIDLDNDLNNIIKLGRKQEDYIESYLDIVENAKSRGLEKTAEAYYEIHHILPRCLGGKDNKENLVLLTMPEHIVCHILLYLAYPDKPGLVRAAMIMSGVQRGDFKMAMFKDGELVNEVQDLIKRASAHTWEIRVVCLDFNNNIIRIYNSLTEASKLDGFSVSKISAALSGTIKSTGGHLWKRYSEICKDSQKDIDTYLENLDNGILPELVISTKKIVCCDLTGKIVSIYDTIKSAEKDGFDSRQISAVLVGRQKTSRNHLWYRYNDFPDHQALMEFEDCGTNCAIPEKVDYRVVLYTDDFSIAEVYDSSVSAALYNNIGESVMARLVKDEVKLGKYHLKRIKDFEKDYPSVRLTSITSEVRDIYAELYSVSCLYKDGTVRYIFPDAPTVTRLTGINSLSIHKSTNKSGYCGGYLWKCTRDLSPQQIEDYKSNDLYVSTIPMLFKEKSMGNILVIVESGNVVGIYPSIQAVAKEYELSIEAATKAAKLGGLVKDRYSVHLLKDFETKYPEKLKEYYESRNTNTDNP